MWWSHRFIFHHHHISITFSKNLPRTNHSTAFHMTCEQLNVYPGLKMHCYLRVWTPPLSQLSWQGVLGEGTRSWPVVGRTQTTACLSQRSTGLCSSQQYARLCLIYVALQILLQHTHTCYISWFIVCIFEKCGESMIEHEYKKNDLWCLQTHLSFIFHLILFAHNY